MRECKDLVIYKRGKELVFQGILLAFIVIGCSVVGIQIFQNEIALEREKGKSELVLKTYNTKVDLNKMTNNYNEYQELLAKAIAEEETTKKVITPTAVTSYTSRGTSVKRDTVSNVETEEIIEEAPTEYKEVIEVKATAYCLCKKCCGKSEDTPGYGITRSGLKIVPGTGMKVIAVDPNIIPLGSKVYVEGVNGVKTYGYAVAADTGSAIKNNKIDLYMDSHEETIKWGIRNMKVYVIE